MVPFPSRIPYYREYISDDLLRSLMRTGKVVGGNPALLRAEGEVGNDYEDQAADFLTRVLEEVRPMLSQVLEARTADRAFIDVFSRGANAQNTQNHVQPNSVDFVSVVGVPDVQRNGRIPIGPLPRSSSSRAAVAPLPAHLRGNHITLFGPADSPKMCANALACRNRTVPGEPQIVADLLASSPIIPKWGADDEDSKTPLRGPFLDAMANLSTCFGLPGKAQPFKRIPGLALPSGSLVYRGDVVPLHIYDFAMHLFHMHGTPEALTFYVPKLETEEEAAYLATVARTAERLVKEQLNPAYVLGTVRFLIVLENPRAVFRIDEIMDALYPYFAGASLGWHDYVAAAGRVFREDESYRMPCKSDPHIVVRHIRESHLHLVRRVKPRGGIAIGGMYGILPLDRDIASVSMQATLVGLVRDVYCQLRRGLDGFWLAHPDFIRFGIALVEAWNRDVASLGSLDLRGPLRTLPTVERVVRALVQNAAHADELIAQLRAPDGAALDRSDPIYHRALLAAEISADAAVMANNDEREVRYNVFQALQYLADWLRGNGCVALPATVLGAQVRVMDDLATTERSRWEVWAELAHGRFPLHRYLTLVHEEFRFIRDFVPANVPADAPKRPAVLWDEGTAAWYAIARRILLLLTTSREPVEFATELLIPFTTAIVRNAADPWATALSLGGANLRMRPEVARADAILERLPVDALVEAWDPLAALTAVPPVELAGALAAGRADSDDSALGSPLARATARVQAALRVADPSAAPLSQAWLDAIVRDFGLTRGGLQVAFAAPGGGALHSLASGDAIESPATLLQCASLSKPVAVALALELLTSLGVRPTDKVNQVAAEHGSSLRIAPSPGLGDDVTIQHCMSHTALDQHYVFGFPLADQAAPGVPPVLQLIAEGSSASVGGSYEPVVARVVPGSRFQYSGAGFVVLHALIEVLAGVPLAEAAAPFTDALTAHLPGPQPQLVLTGESRLRALARGAAPPPSEPAVARGTLDDGSAAPVLSFPPCAAGGLASARGIAAFLAHLTAALSPAALAPLSPTARSTMPISHDTALLMTAGTNRSLSPAVQAFMAAEAGVGIFVAEAGLNTVLLHQAANEGYRGVFAWVASGPEAGAGIVVLASGDNGAVPALAEVTRSALLALGVSGFDPSSLPSPRMGFDTSALPQETIVNRGLRDLVFAGFQRRRPPLIAIPGRPAHPYTALDLMRGASVVSVTDDRFAQAINLVDQAEPIFDPAAFTEAGKEMDSWESQRHNPAPDVGDVATYQLVAPAVIRAVEISTKWHDGNQAVACAIRGRRAADQQWFDLLPASPLQGHAWHRYLLPESAPVDLVAVHNIPDGGISRLRCYAAPPDASWVPGAGRFPDAISSVEAATKLAPDPAPDAAAVARNWARVPSDALVNVASVGLGASVIAVSNQHYGPAAAILASTEPRGMFDGFETARGRGDGAQEFVEIALGAPASLVAVDVDMTFFRNNNPASLSVAFSAAVSGEFELRPRSTQSLPVKHYRGNTMRVLLQREAAGALGGAPVRRVRIESRPCGGFNRVRVWGRPVAEPVARL